MEESFNFDKLKDNTSLVNSMDDNMNIHIEDFLKNQSISENYKFNKEEILGVIKNSSTLNFDSENQIIKLNYKPKRRIIVFRDVPKNNQNSEEIRKLFSYNNNVHEITEIKEIREMFYIFFSTEEEAIKAFRDIEDLRENENKVKD